MNRRGQICIDWLLGSDLFRERKSFFSPDTDAAIHREHVLVAHFLQIVGGKRYDLAVWGRRSANATFSNPHATDKSTQLIFGMDLTPLIANANLDIADHVCGFIDKFKADARRKISRQLRR